VNRLSRELTALRQAQQQQQQQQQQQGNGGVSHSPAALQIPDPNAPNAEIMLEAMRRENDQLRGRLVDTERDYVRISRLNEIYREELIEHRRRVSRFFFFSLKPILCTGFWFGQLTLSLDWIIGGQLDRDVLSGSLFAADTQEVAIFIFRFFAVDICANPSIV